MDRRNFIGTLSSASVGFAVSTHLLVSSRTNLAGEAKGSQFDTLTKSLLTDWCDGMIRRQIDAEGRQFNAVAS